MVIILRVATVCTVFRDILPDDVDDVIVVGKRNMKRFGLSVKEFQWHLEVLDKLDAACQDHIMP